MKPQADDDSGLKTKAWSWAVAMRSYILVGVHLAVFAFCYLAAWCVRFEFDLPAAMGAVIWRTLPLVLCVRLIAFYLSGNFHGWWRHVTFADLIPLIRAATLSSLVLVVIEYFSQTLYHIPRSVLLVDWALTILLLGGLRSCWRYTREHFTLFRRHKTPYRKALVYGADMHSPHIVAQIHSDPTLRYRVVGFIDPDSSKRKTRLGGIVVLGGVDVIFEASRLLGVKDLFVVSGVLAGKQLRRLVEECEQAGVSVKMIPPVAELLTLHRLQPRNVDINDLLRREPVALNSEAISGLLEGGCVLVTGAGGSIGSEICRQVLKFRPRTLVLLERAENSLYMIERELEPEKGDTRLKPVLMDILDRRGLREVLRLHKPNVIFHAAAHKHVPMMETNEREAVRNNVFGTKGLADLANEMLVDCFVMISTDKAVKPSSVMGVSKHLAERYVNALSQASNTRFVVVRFGNVLGSAGSVVPLFQEQIRNGGPVTVTHPEMSRYFMTIPEASQLVLQAASMGKGGEVFVLEMGEPVKIVDLAKDLINLSGLSSHDIGITYSGIRPGEKLHEELYFEEEQTLPTQHEKVRVAYHRPFDFKTVHHQLQELRRVLNGPGDLIRRKLGEIVREYTVPVHQTHVNGAHHHAKAGRPTMAVVDE